nr:MAG TPA: hypothetical protein [Caudoviricetes sp.]
MNNRFNAVAGDFPATIDFSRVNTGYSCLGQCTHCFFKQGYAGRRGRVFHGFNDTHNKFL